MSEIERYEGGTVAPISGHELDVIMRQADMLAQSDIIPKDYRRKPANIVVAAMTGRTFGWDAITAMRNGHVIEGTWSIKPEAMLALVRRAGHSVEGESSPTGATITGKRFDSGDTLTVTFDEADAKRAQLLNKNTWKQYPKSMYWARAVSQLCRMLFADVTLGLSYTPEELGAEVTEDGDIIDVTEHPMLPASDDPRISGANAAALVQRCAEHGLPVAEVVLLGTKNRTADPAEVHKDEVSAVKEAIDFLSEPAPEIEPGAEPPHEGDVQQREGDAPSSVSGFHRKDGTEAPGSPDDEPIEAEIIDGGEPF